MTRTRFYINDQIYLFYEYNPCRSFPYMEGMGSSKNLCNDVHKLVFFHTFPYKECVIFHLSIDGNLLCSDGHMEEFLYIFSDRYIYPFCNTQFLFCDDIVWEQCLSKLCKCNHHNFGHIARYKDGHIGVLWHNQSGMTLMKDLYNKVSLLHVHKSDAFSSLLSYNHRILCNIFLDKYVHYHRSSSMAFDMEGCESIHRRDIVCHSRAHTAVLLHMAQYTRHLELFQNLEE